MDVIPVRARQVSVHIHADRRLAFQVLTAFGAGGQNQANSKVLQRDEYRLLVEFHTPGISLTGRRRVYRTVEWVPTQEPAAIFFDGVEGPLSMLHDRFDLKEEGGCTRPTYRSEFGLSGWILGWLVARLVVRRMLHRTMVEHMAELKATIEERAKRSRMFPQKPCNLLDSAG